MKICDQSYLFLCFGQSYIDDAIDFIDTLRHFHDDRKTNIVIDPQDYEYALNKKIFNKIIPFDIGSDPLIPLCRTKFEKFCLLPRLRLPQFLQTRYTLVLDTDILCAFYTDDVWSFLINRNQPLTMLGSVNNRFWHWGHWGSICDHLNMKPYETHGGLFFIDNNDPARIMTIWQYAEYAFRNFDDLGFLRMYQNGAVDEPCFAYAFNKSNLLPVNFSERSIMTFNLDATKHHIPTKQMTETMQSRLMENYIPFIHMFEKNKTMNFMALKNKVLNIKL